MKGTPLGRLVLPLAGLAVLGSCGGQAPRASGADQASVPSSLTEPSGPAEAAVASTVEQVLGSARHTWLRWPDLADVAPSLRALYAAEADRLFWFAGERAYPALEGAIGALAASAERGLAPRDYDAERIASEWTRQRGPAAGGGSERALFDLALSASVLRAIDAVHRGRVHPRTVDWGYDVKPRTLDRAALLREARDGLRIPALLDGLEPSYPHYVRNRRVLAHYRALAAAGEPEPVPALARDRRKVEPGQPWAGVPPLAKRLRLLGDLQEDPLPASAPDGTALYEGVLVEALKRFQARHILDADGVIGKATIDALNVPLARRVRQLELALERGRWLPRLDRPTVFVNVPLFRLWATDPVGGQEPLRMKVVVGKSMGHRTPIFVAQMEYVVFRPYWNPPYGIASREIVPHARRDPAYLQREELEIVASGDEDAPALPATPENLDAIVRGRLFVRQRPGPRNSLGLAKFIFPNQQNVYMHGTPAPQLFSRTRRDFSHGCIRLEEPAALAEWVLRDQPAWTRARIEAAMQGERPARVNLREPLLVVLFYDTVHVNSEGVVHFVDDIYGHDRTLDEALDRGYPYPEAG
ncbi:MAG TPA: L,D-transpeptidase family protein [Vicinamibacteria bacterium]|nr:L,D-transpeptidase family protein [Vicinamibacteria bacterium]